MFHFVYYANSFNFSSCLEGVPLEAFKKLGYCSWFSRIVFFVQNLAACLWILSKVLIMFLGSMDPMMLTHIQVLVGQVLCRL